MSFFNMSEKNWEIQYAKIIYSVPFSFLCLDYSHTIEAPS